MTIRVLHVFKTYFPDTSGGVERVIRELAEAGRAEGIAANVLAVSANAAPALVEVDGHEVHRVPLTLDVASTALSWRLLPAFARLARRHDIVHYHFPWPAMDLLHLLVRPARSVVTYHSDIVRQKRLMAAYGPLMRRFLARVDAVVATSPDYLRSSPVLGALPRPAHVVPIGIAPARPAVEPERLAYWRDRLGGPFFLFVGVLRYYKGLPTLLEAARATGLPVVVAGDGEYGATLKAAGLPNVTLVGAVSDADKEALLDLSTAFVFPSHLRSEAYGVALVEAARAGRAMISCDLGTGTSFVNRAGETGLVVPPADADALGRAMHALWQDRKRTAAMGRAARRHFEAELTAPLMARRYADIYRELMTRPG